MPYTNGIFLINEPFSPADIRAVIRGVCTRQQRTYCYGVLAAMLKKPRLHHRGGELYASFRVQCSYNLGYDEYSGRTLEADGTFVTTSDHRRTAWEQAASHPLPWGETIATESFTGSMICRMARDTQVSILRYKKWVGHFSPTAKPLIRAVVDWGDQISEEAFAEREATRCPHCGKLP
jgi:hypothetical protein